jgi:hypothetical protein
MHIDSKASHIANVTRVVFEPRLLPSTTATVTLVLLLYAALPCFTVSLR